MDPYSIYPDLPDEMRCVGRVNWHEILEAIFGSGLGDLPEDTRDKLWEGHKAKLAFPAGLPKGEPITV